MGEGREREKERQSIMVDNLFFYFTQKFKQSASPSRNRRPKSTTTNESSRYHHEKATLDANLKKKES